jgi:D-glutamate cyclase
VSAMENRIDRLVNLDIGGRGAEGLYEAARESTGGALAMTAARRLGERLKPGDPVLMTTGFMARALVAPSIGETDGPPGTAVLARALQKSLGVLPIVVTDEQLVPAVGSVLQAAGFSLLELDEARQATAPGGRRTAAAVVLSFPADDESANVAADRLLDELRPRFSISVERPGRNVAGYYHDMRGQGFQAGPARTDLLMERAQERGIPLLAVGDGGNEIGMGLVRDAVMEHVPFGNSCRCPCGRGLAARTRADLLVTAAVSNWGCYAIVAGMAILKGDSSILHTAGAERRLLEASARAGLIDSVSGCVDDGVDGLPAGTHAAVVQLLHTMASMAIAG